MEEWLNYKCKNVKHDPLKPRMCKTCGERLFLDYMRSHFVCVKCGRIEKTMVYYMSHGDMECHKTFQRQTYSRAHHFRNYLLKSRFDHLHLPVKTLTHMFRTVNRIFNEHYSSTRKNIIRYNFIVLKLMQLLGKPLAADALSLPTRKTVLSYDRIWKTVCHDAKWKFIPTL